VPTPYLVNTLGTPYVGQASFQDGGGDGGSNYQNAPLEYNGEIFVIHTTAQWDYPTSGSVIASFLAVASSTDRQNFTVLDQAHAPEVQANPHASPSYSVVDLANHRVVFVSIQKADSKLFVTTFDLDTKTWGTTLAIDGPVIGFGRNTAPLVMMAMLSATKFFLVYNSTNFTNLTYVFLDSGVWGTPVDIIIGSSSLAGLPLGIVQAGGFTHFWYSRIIMSAFQVSHAKLCYNRIDSSGTLLGEVQIVDATTFQSVAFQGSVPKYLSGVNRIAFPNLRRSLVTTPTVPKDWFLVWVDDPSGTPVLSIEGVADAVDDFGPGPPYFFTNPAESAYYLIAEDILSDNTHASPVGGGWETLFLFQRAASASPGLWAGPNVFYSAQVEPPAGPGYPFPPDSPIVPTPPAELNSLAFTMFADGTIAGTFGMLCSVCGVEFFISLPSGLITIGAAPFFPSYTHRRGAQGGH
jgi:hypothetical protein